MKKNKFKNKGIILKNLYLVYLVKFIFLFFHILFIIKNNKIFLKINIFSKINYYKSSFYNFNINIFSRK